MSVHVDIGATLTEWRELPNDGGWHPSISKFSCDLSGRTTDHGLRRSAWLVEFTDLPFAPLTVCYTCAREVFGVNPSS